MLRPQPRKKEDAHAWSHDRTGLKGAAANLKGGGKHDILSLSPDLDKLNLNCRMNYSIIFAEISFYPETSIIKQTNFNCLETAERQHFTNESSANVEPYF